MTEDHGSRLTIIENTLQDKDRDTRITVLENSFQDMKDTHKEMMDKLDELLALKNQGMGAFWLATGLFGIVIAVVGSNIIDWFKGLFH